MLKFGRCRLCGNDRDLAESHAFPRFGYKRYVSDQSKGGRYTELSTWKDEPTWQHHNRQRKYHWFCEECEHRFEEPYAADLLKSIENNRGPELYDGRLMTFVVSISWRVALLQLQKGVPPGPFREQLKKACGVWRQFLLGKRDNTLPFSQHALIDFGQEIDWSKSMGGMPLPEEMVLVSRIGSLVIIAMLDRTKLSAAERRMCGASDVTLAGGTLRVLERGRPQEHLPPYFVEALNHVDTKLIGQASSLPVAAD